MGNETKHLDLLDQVIHALMDVSEPVDLVAGEMRGGGHQILMLGTKGEFISEGGGFDVGPEGRVLGDILHPFAVVIDHMMKVFETLDVILFSDNPFHGFAPPEAHSA